ncbi:hypothetical protein RchiOBHm_Chr1g0361451 [Rosa chinensis]|uniref:Uncharacterized protein n=1 Tax=Rosa chinensis TaxID=74649 RepID=A0A2P6SIV6_ROSCH|nr:hypothetical protein RchiOBHm_Chr1g0361451 [Rosa chinensis]
MCRRKYLYKKYCGRVHRVRAHSRASILVWFVAEVSFRVSTFGCLSLFLERTKEEWGLSMSFASLLWRFQNMLMDVVFGNFMVFFYLCACYEGCFQQIT